ncbi:MAG: hypothetical protein PSN34_14625 [Urechidicola sp.]|nr:hypothetical protein [Urechidicola sp.]
MDISGSIYSFPKEIKLLIGSFLVVLSIGFFLGLSFVNETTNANPDGIETQYLGNEDIEDAPTMKFKKSEREILTLVHNHMLSLSVIFFLLAIILSTTDLNKKFKLFLMIEPFASILLTFGGIYILWSGVLWFKYVIIFSGILMTFSFVASVFVILMQLFQKK